NRQGQVVYEHETKTAPVLPPAEAGVVNAALEGVVNDGTGTAAGIGRPLAGKTGTTENHADAWFIGYVPQMATAVWVGYPDSLVPMTDVHGIAVAGGTYPARIFAGYMKPALAQAQVENIYTASPDDLSLHNFGDAPPTAPTSSSSTSSTSPPPSLPPANIQDPGSGTQPQQQPNDTQPQYQRPQQPPPTYGPATTTTTQARQKQSASSQTTLGP
ncbi:MAG: hypothetical protein JO086_04270, partial [Acidimicrobiia bacterium]|nr:hypothetical protein [Acidimicrobiia bacterium]